MPRYKYTGLNLGQVLSRHGGDLATQTESGQWLSFHPTKSMAVKLAGPGQGGFLHPHKSVTLFGPQLFDSKSDAEDDALAKLLHNTQHEGQLSTLPTERRAAVKKRYDEIQKWTENAKPKKPGALTKGTGKGYIVEQKSSGSVLFMQFEPPDAYKSKFENNGSWRSWYLDDTEANRALVEEAHAKNETFQRRDKLEKAPKPDARTAQRAKDALDGANVLFQAARHYMMIEAAIVTNLLNAPTLSEVLVLYDGVTEENHCAHLVQRLKAQAKPGAPQQTIRISGPVRYPGEYPMPASHRLADAVFVAGGLKDSASLYQAEIARYTQDESGIGQTHILNVDLAAAMAGQSSLILQSRDTILIKSIPQFAQPRTIILKGEVRYPGEYTFREGETLKEYPEPLTLIL